jgi:hypothetical protein
MIVDDIIKDAQQRMEKAINHLRDELRTIRTGSCQPGSGGHDSGELLRHADTAQATGGDQHARPRNRFSSGHLIPMLVRTSPRPFSKANSA